MGMENIEHIVYLMLENRSFDNVLGWLYENESPNHFIPSLPKSIPQIEYDGLQNGNYYNENDNKVVHVSKIAPTDGQQIPSVDPHEEHEHVEIQIASNNGVPMGGFLKDFSSAGSADPNEIMKTYTPESLPVINGLAKNFAVSDAYFSSIPTQTNCNRAFAATGNSLGYHSGMFKHLKAWVNNSFGKVEEWALDVTFNQKTIWGHLSDNGFGSPDDWVIYYSNLWPTNKLNNYCFTEDLFWPTMSKKGWTKRHAKYPKNFADLEKFMSQARAGTLPRFSFLEPAWYLKDKGYGWNGNDYHPPGNVGCGEQLLYEIYTALQSNSEAWPKTLFIINFDEHGGTYDHVTPPSGVKAPWEDYQDGTPPPHSCEDHFDFKSLGVRVPLILVSPLIKEKTVFRSETGVPYDHTSIIATVLNFFGLTDRSKWGLGSRTANAPTFENVITLPLDKARKHVSIPTPLSDSCQVDEDAEPNDLQMMILHRCFARTIDQNNFSKKRFQELYEDHFKDVKTMTQVNEATKKIFNAMSLEIGEKAFSELSPSEKVSATFKKELDEMGISYHEKLYDAILTYLGPSIHDKDASLVACSDPEELQLIKTNFLMGKLGLENSPRLDEAIHEICEGLGQSNRQKHRVTFYYLLVAILKKESVFIN